MTKEDYKITDKVYTGKKAKGPGPQDYNQLKPNPTAIASRPLTT